MVGEYAEVYGACTRDKTELSCADRCFDLRAEMVAASVSSEHIKQTAPRKSSC